MSEPTRPGRLFRARRRGDALHIGREPLPAVEAWIAANRARKEIKEGKVVPYDRSGGEEAAVTPTAGPDFARSRRRLAPPK